MMSAIMITIFDLIRNLPRKDEELAYDFLKDKKFEELLDLVTSSIVITEKKVAREEEEAKLIDLKKLYQLKAILINYLKTVYDIDYSELTEEEEEREIDEEFDY